jgi:hypothetical protein
LTADRRFEIRNALKVGEMGLGIAIKAFFAALTNKQMAEQIGHLLADQGAVAGLEVDRVAEGPPQQPESAPSRDPAVTLLAALQREARLVDLIQEDLSQYADAQVGAAARPCLQQCAGVLNRLFELQPLVDASEGESVDVGENASPMRFQWIGEGSAASGSLVHHGWQATKVELPIWSGEVSDANIIAPAQVQAP